MKAIVNESVGLRFLNHIHTVCDALVRYIQNTNMPMQMTSDDIRNYESSEKCYCCYNQYKYKKCTYDGMYVSAVCMECDVKMRKKEYNLLTKFYDFAHVLTEEERVLAEKISRRVTKCIQSQAEYNKFNESPQCSEYQSAFKVRDHDHLTGRYRGSACTACNIKLKLMSRIPIIFNICSEYDSHFIIPELTRFINENKYLSRKTEKETPYTTEELASNFDNFFGNLWLDYYYS